jgi:hypothetical protein
MKINQMQLYAAINEFIDREIIPLSATMDLPKQFMFGIKIRVVKHKIENIVKTYLNKSEFKFLELVDENGGIDVDTIYSSAADMMQQLQQVEIGGITFKMADLQNLYSIMQKYANQGVIQ